MSAEAGGGAWGPAGSAAGDRPVFRWYEPGVAEQRPLRSRRGATVRRRGTAVGVALLGLLLLALLLAFLVFGHEVPPAGELLLVCVVFRHGERTPTKAYPLDPHRAADAWPEGWGQLTNRGKRQLFGVGQWLRGRYGPLLGPLYNPDLLRVDSSDSDRCLMSAGALLAGLLPPEPAQRWHPDLAWQPVPVHARPRASDYLIAGTRPCPRYSSELQRAYASPELRRLDAENEQLYADLSRASGLQIRNVTGVELLFNTLEIEEQRGLQLPPWARPPAYPERMRHLAARSLALFADGPALQRLRGGPLLKDIAQHMRAKAAGELRPDRRMFLYSAHDLTLVCVWRALGLADLLKPAYGASLLFELRWQRPEADPEVQVLFVNSSESAQASQPPLQLPVPGCGRSCPLPAFLAAVAPVLPDDWERECRQDA